MIKNYAALILVLFFFSSTKAQRSVEIGFATGVTNYYGDLGNEKTFPLTSTRPGINLTFRNFLNNPSNSGMEYQSFSLETRFSWHRIGYDETQAIGDQKGFELPNYGRGLSFRTDVYGISTHVTYTLYASKYKPLSKQHAAIFVSAGVGIFYAEPKADLFRGSIDINNRYYFWSDGTTRNAPEAEGKGEVIQKDGVYETSLNEWSTEGQGHNSELGQKPPYKYCHVGFPFGAGFRWGLSSLTTLSLEFSYYYFMTDYMDDVSSRYATKDEIIANYPGDPKKQQLATYISDPTGWGTNGLPNSPPTSIRGNERKQDSYSFVSLEFAYKLQFKGHKAKL